MVVKTHTWYTSIFVVAFMFNCDQSLDHDVNYQYDILDDPITQIEQKMKNLMDNLSCSCKTLVLSGQYSGHVSTRSSFTIYRNIYIFVWSQTEGGRQIYIPWEHYKKTLHTWRWNTCSARVKKATGAFALLKESGLTKCTKVSVYNACVLTCLFVYLWYIGCVS